ncbi:MAG TPA: VCBS repeat-containing protein [Kofleriaceae bacterium]
MARLLVVFAIAAACGGGASVHPDAPPPDVLACPSRFDTATYPIATGASPIAVASGDFNDDAIIDLAVVDAGAATVAILIGTADGRGTFGAATAFPVDAQPVALVVHDFDGDGKLDLAVANAGGNDVSLLYGNGNGTFEPPDNYPVAAGPRAIVLGDFNGDGVLDVATAGAGSVSVLIAGAGGELATHVDTVVTNAALAGLTAGDFDRDGHLDLATGSTASGEVAVLRGDGDGSFAAPALYPTGSGPVSAIASGDVDADGHLDVLAASSTGTPGIVELRGMGDGTLAAASTRAVTQDPAIAVAIGDFDGDAILDVAYATASAIAIAYAVTPGVFAAPTSLAATAAPANLAAGDFDRNGELDLAAPNASADSVSIFLDHGCGP